MRIDRGAVWWLGLAALPVLSACGGGSSSPANQAPIPTIMSPASGTTFRAGDTINFAGSATDAEDGTIGAAGLVWWAELHHDTHSHPFQPETAGASGSVNIPVRGETSANIFYRFHLRATDSAGATTEVTQDITPQTSQLTLATVPAGLALTLDGQPMTAPTAVTGVVGIERELGAADQSFNGRRYTVASWSDGGAAAHTIATPSANTTFTATFTDIGPATNNPPTVVLTAPANGSTGTTGTPISLMATATDSDGSVAKVEFFDGATKLGEDASSPYALSWTPTTTGAHSLIARATDNLGLITASAAVSVTINASTGDTQPPIATLTAPANLATGLAGTLAVTATATDNVGVTSVEFQVDGAQVGATLAAAPYAINVDSNAYASGQHVLRVRASDAAGNTSAWATATVEFGGSRALPAGFTRNESWVTGLADATAIAQAPDGRFFVAQQGGALRVVKAGVLLATPFIQLTVDPSGERGLIGVTLHPNFATNGWVYLHYTTPENGTHNRISRYTVSSANPDVVSVGSELRIADLPALSVATNHNGGAMHFSVDGKLYVGVGDNTNSGAAPLLTSVLGKLLRFNDDGSIPTDNPFYAAQTLTSAIWARGLRNPYTFAIQPGTGRMHINDVGQNTWEEINLGVPGADYGWPSTEGPTSAAGVTAPLFSYKHSDASPRGSGPGGFFVGFAIAGGSFYPNTAPFPAAYRNSYYFADYVSKFVGRYDWVNNASYAFGGVTGEPVDMLTGNDGALYVLTRTAIVRFSSP
jgi:glucose/arabinose dehydrogenase